MTPAQKASLKRRVDAEVRAVSGGDEDALVERTCWQSIETAPKDGTLVLLWSNGWVIGSWQDASPPDGGADDIGQHGIPARWEDNGEGFVLRPTHWMPLPDPPPGWEARTP